MYLNQVSNQLKETIAALLAEELAMPPMVVPPYPTGGTGLHLAIARQPKQRGKVLYWELTLKQYNRSELAYQRMDNAIDKLRSLYPLAIVVPQPIKDDKIVQVNLSIAVDRHYTGVAIATHHEPS